MPKLLMTPDELHHLTGRTQPAAQMRWLNVHGWIYTIGCDGLPKVACAYFERKLVLGEEPSSVSVPDQGAQQWQVNVAALRNLSTH